MGIAFSLKLHCVLMVQIETWQRARLHNMRVSEPHFILHVRLLIRHGASATLAVASNFLYSLVDFTSHLRRTGVSSFCIDV